MRQRICLVLLFLMIFALFGSADSGAPVNPLTGTWISSMQKDIDGHDVIQKCTLILNADGSFEIQTACVPEIANYTFLTMHGSWSTDSTTITLVSTSPTNTTMTVGYTIDKESGNLVLASTSGGQSQAFQRQ